MHAPWKTSDKMLHLLRSRVRLALSIACAKFLPSTTSTQRPLCARGISSDTKVSCSSSVLTKVTGLCLIQAAFIGLGAMGSRCAENLLKSGLSLIVHDLCPERMKPLIQLGAEAAASPADAAATPGNRTIAKLLWGLAFTIRGACYRYRGFIYDVAQH